MNGNDALIIGNSIFANSRNSFNPSTGTSKMSLASSYNFIEVCAGVPTGETAHIETVGGFPTPISFEWMSTSSNGDITGCRSAIVLMTRGVTLSLRLKSGRIYGVNGQTSWSSFSLNNAGFLVGNVFSGFSPNTYSGLIFQSFFSLIIHEIHVPISFLNKT